MMSDRPASEIVEFDVRTDEMLINMGPQHPSTHGVLRLVLRTDGEVVTEVTPHIGYLHRSAEKIGENLTPRQFLPYTDRLDYLAGMNMNLGWALCVEKLLGQRVSEKTRHLRVIITELSRIASHLVAAGCYGLDLGSFTPFMWTFREREKILNLFEEVCGARLTYSYITVGRRDGRSAVRLAGALRGVPRSVRAGDRRPARPVDQQRDFHPPHGRHRRACSRRWPSTMAARARCCGAAASIGTCAATASRSSRDMYDGYTWRVIAPTDGQYPQDHPYPPVPTEAVLGDSWHRYFVRMLEVVQSMDLIRQAMEKYSQAGGVVDGPIQVKTKAAQGRGLSGNRGPQGANGLHDHQRRLRRCPGGCGSAAAVSAIFRCCRSYAAACWWPTFPSIVGSLDLVLGEIDR